ncbi:MAG: hypothetical protein HYX85_02290 [Chloroflexi bacterium]|nr:hypothetical protein [Chloroflexota bacterium]
MDRSKGPFAAALRVLMPFLLLVPVAVLAGLPGPAPALAAANVTVTTSPVSGPPGTFITAGGTGFTVNSSYSITFGAFTLATGLVPEGGTVNASFAVPALPRGGYNVIITTNASDGTNSPPPSFLVTPIVSITTSVGRVGDTLGINGNGFAASLQVTIYFDGIAVGTTTSNGNGSISTTFTIPTGIGGLHSVTAGDFIGLAPGINFSILPKMTVSATSLPVGSTVVVSGTGFAGSSQMTFLLDEVVLSGVINTNANGSFTTGTIAVPEIAGGSHTFKAQDAVGNSAVAEVTVTPIVSITPDNGPAGTAVAMTGKGFFASATITIAWIGQTVTTSPETIVSNGQGSFIANFKALPGPSTAYAVSANDGTNSGTVNFIIKPTASVSPATGPVGAAVTVRGAGFKASTAVTVNYDNFLAATVSSDSSGNVSATFQVLPSTAGEHKITINDQTNSLSFPFRVVPAAKLSPSSGFVGSDITVSGNGFGASRPITIRYDDTQIVQGTADAGGTFIIVFKAPVSKGGNHLVTLTDGINTETQTFAMDSTSPSAPTLLQPLTGIKADRLPTLDWSDVSDPSGLTYTLELATDAGFANVLIRKQGLTASAYTLTEAEKLKSVSSKRPYHWRVKAIDSASNESPWAASSTFFVGLVLQSWAWVIIIAGAAIVLGVAGYVIGLMIRRRILH